MSAVAWASLKVCAVGAGAFERTFTYGKRYLERPEADIPEMEYLLHGPDDGARNHALLNMLKSSA